jgi:hypothetical protein
VSAASGAPWRDVYKTTTASLASTICVDTGRGYAKYGLASNDAPSVLQICMPGAEASQETLFPAVLQRLGARTRGAAEGRRNKGRGGASAVLWAPALSRPGPVASRPGPTALRAPLSRLTLRRSPMQA